jgi:hypothetical protein
VTVLWFSPGTTTLCNKVCPWLMTVIWLPLLHNVVVPGENHRAVTSHWHTLLHNVVVPGENHRAVTSHGQTLLHIVVIM